MDIKLTYSEKINDKKCSIREIWQTKSKMSVKIRSGLEQLAQKTKIKIDIWTTVMCCMTQTLILKKTRLTFELIINNKLK